MMDRPNTERPNTEQPITGRRNKGRLANLAGGAAESQVADEYTRRGHRVIERRWRGQAGEIDLVLRSQNEVIFVEVKRARSHAEASHRISKRQQERICAAAEEFLSTEPAGSLTPMRVDAAFVDAHGTIQILENAIAA